MRRAGSPRYVASDEPRRFADQPFDGEEEDDKGQSDGFVPEIFGFGDGGLDAAIGDEFGQVGGGGEWDQSTFGRRNQAI